MQNPKIRFSHDAVHSMRVFGNVRGILFYVLHKFIYDGSDELLRIINKVILISSHNINPSLLCLFKAMFFFVKATKLENIERFLSSDILVVECSLWDLEAAGLRLCCAALV